MEDMNMADMINQPPHYVACRPKAEPIDLTESLDFCIGNFFKYFSRAGLKEGNPEEQDLKKAIFYLRREIWHLYKGNWTGYTSDPISSEGLSYLYWMFAKHPFLELIFFVRDECMECSVEELQSLADRLDQVIKTGKDDPFRNAWSAELIEKLKEDGNE